jgi:hypothetical protein
MVSPTRLSSDPAAPDIARRMGRMPPIRIAGAKSFGGGPSAMIFGGRPNGLV